MKLLIEDFTVQDLQSQEIIRKYLTYFSTTKGTIKKKVKHQLCIGLSAIFNCPVNDVLGYLIAALDEDPNFFLKPEYFHNEHNIYSSTNNDSLILIDEIDNNASSNPSEEEIQYSFLRLKEFKKASYRQMPQVYVPILHELSKSKDDKTKLTISEIHDKTNVPIKTLRNWNNNLENDPTWTPTRFQNKLNPRILTDREESLIREYILQSYVRKQKPLTLTMLQAILSRHLQMSSKARFHKREDLICSRTFVKSFLKRNKLSYRKIRVERRKPLDPNEVKLFLEEIKEIKDKYTLDCIYNADETAWNVAMIGDRTITESGVDGVHININGNPKQNITILSTITASGKKLKLFMIAKGITNSCHKQLGSRALTEAIVKHSNSGWMNQKVFVEYLYWLNEQDSRPKCLLLDQYKCHISEETMEVANKLNIRLVRIPKGGTGKFQPLDKRIFGVFKKKGVSLVEKELIKIQDNGQELDELVFNKEFAANIALNSWNEIKTETILEAWKIEGNE